MEQKESFITRFCIYLQNEEEKDFEEMVADSQRLNWNNPYVLISFFCRICNKEQMFHQYETKWKEHFMTHINAQERQEIERSNEDGSKVPLILI